MVPEQPSVLVVVTSSGEYPFLEIEERGQLPTFGQEQMEQLDCVWVEGNPRRSRRWVFRLLNRALGAVHRSLYVRPVEVHTRTHQYFFRDGRLTRARHHAGAVAPHWGLRLRVNWGHFSAKSYSPPNDRNGFSRLVGGLLSRLAGGKAQRSGKRVTLDFPNSYFLTTWRSLLRYKAVLDFFEFDFVLFTTSTCYVDLLRLERFANGLPRERIYAGHLMNFAGPFIAGNSVLMSRDVVEAVIRHERDYRLDLPDDVSLGLLIRDFGLAEPVSVPTETLPFSADGPDDMSSLLSDSYLYRCKAEPATRNPELVIETMRCLHSCITERRKIPRKNRL